MSPYQGKTKSVVVLVPRHNSQRIGPRLTTHVEKIARKAKKRTDVKQTAYDPQSILAQAVDSASEWNSLLMTARAERGPQWDIGTQMFMVDEGSDLYYDSTPLREFEKDAEEEKALANGSGEGASGSKQERGSMPPPSNHPTQIPLQGVGSQGPDSPQLRRGQMPMPMTPHTPQQSFSPRHPGQFTPGPGGFNQGMPVTPQHQQFYNDSGMRMGGVGMGSPMGGGGMGGMGMHMDGMSMGGIGGMPGMGGMGGMGMGSPDPRRMATRRGPMGMDDGFGGMH